MQSLDTDFILSALFASECLSKDQWLRFMSGTEYPLFSVHSKTALMFINMLLIDGSRRHNEWIDF